MKMKQISDSTLKITIMLDDLEERGMELADFLIPQEKTEEFFYAVLDELDLPASFKESGMLSFRVTPKPDKLDIFVTKSEIDQNLNFDDLADFADMEDISQMSPDEFLKTVEKSIRQQSQPDQEAVRRLEQAEEEDLVDSEDQVPDHFIYYILSFASVEEVVAFAHQLAIETDTSELYKYQNRYYLTVLVSTEDHPKEYPSYLLARLLEFADEADLSRAVLLEHGELLLAHQAIEGLRKVRLA